MPLKPPTVIESNRLLVRLVEEADLTDLLAINGDDEVTRYLPYASWQSLADGQAWCKRMAALNATGNGLQFVALEKSSRRVVATCLLFRYDEQSARAELGYVLGREHWGRGLMHEALSALISYAFETCALRRVEAEVNPANDPSNRLLQKLGFRKEGLLRQRWFDKGSAHDTNIYGLLGEEWRNAEANR